MFNGQTSTVAVPCKYRLADIQCGDYQLRITPGSKLDSNNTFSPNSVFARIQKTGLAGYAWVLTTSSRLEKVSHLAFLFCDGTILTAVSHPHRQHSDDCKCLQSVAERDMPIETVRNQQTRELISARKTSHINTRTKLRVTVSDSGLCCCVYVWRLSGTNELPCLSILQVFALFVSLRFSDSPVWTVTPG